MSGYHRKGDPTIRITVQVRLSQLRWLDAEADKKYMSRSEEVREIIDEQIRSKKI